VKRRLFNVLAAVSLVLFWATLGMWVRGYPVGNTFYCNVWHWSADVGFAWHLTGAAFTSYHDIRSPFSLGRSKTTLSGTNIQFAADKHWGFLLQKMPLHAALASQMDVYAVAAPDWFLAAIFSIAPAIWLVLRRRARSLDRTGFCAGCGYDLRGTPDRCPECGMVPMQRNISSV
jgi:hypothetical protein